MDITRMIQVGVARADLLICRLLVLPWGNIGMGVLITAAVIYLCCKSMNERRDAD